MFSEAFLNAYSAFGPIVQLLLFDGETVLRKQISCGQYLE